MPSVIAPAGQIIGEEGTAVTRRPTLNFIGSTVTAADNAAQNRTDVTITSSGTSITFAADSGLPVFNVKDATYGATGDGTTDDTTAIQNAINAAMLGQNGGGIVYFPVGFYKITAPLTITGPVSLLGEQAGISWQSNLVAMGAVIRNVQTAGNAITITRTDGRPTTKLSNAVTIRDLAIDTVAPTYAAYNSSNPGLIVDATAIYCGANANNVIIENCFIQRHKRGVNMCGDTTNYTAFVEVRNTKIFNCPEYGIYDGGGVGNFVRGCQISCIWDEEWTSTYGGGTQYGVYLSGAASGDATYIENTVVIGYVGGFYFGSDNNSCINCTADTCYTGFVVAGTYSRIANCVSTACYSTDGVTFLVGGAGINCAGADNVVSNCIVYRGTIGVSVTGSRNIVTGCHLRSTTDNFDAISMSGTLNNIVISGNILCGNGGSKYGIQYNGGSFTGSITGNSITNSASTTTPSGGIKVKSNYGLVDN